MTIEQLSCSGNIEECMDKHLLKNVGKQKILDTNSECQFKKEQMQNNFSRRMVEHTLKIFRTRRKIARDSSLRSILYQ